jgi:organic hydroperoxide reductase OsmC/OhrA
LRFGRIRLEVESSHPREDLEPMIQRAVNFCYVSNTLRHPPELEVVTAGRDATHAAPPPRD